MPQHFHTFQWNDRDAWYMCTGRGCRTIEAQCGACGKRLGVPRARAGEPRQFCSEEHAARHRATTRDDQGPSGLSELLRI